MELDMLFLLLGSGALILWVWGYKHGREKGYGHLTSLTTNPFLLSEIEPRDRAGRRAPGATGERPSAREAAADAEREEQAKLEQAALIARLDAMIAEGKKKTPGTKKR